MFDLYRTTTTTNRLGTWKSSAHHLLHKLSAQGWIFKQTRFPRLELIWNLAILRDLYILCVRLTLKNIKLLRTAKYTTLDEPGDIKIWYDFQFRAALFYLFFTLGTLTMYTVFQNLKTCFAEDNWPRVWKAMCTWC